MVFKGPQLVITNGDMSTSLVSEVAILPQLVLVSYAINWTGSSLDGNFTVEVSNDYSENVDGSVRNPGTWTELPLSDDTSITIDTDSGFIDIDVTAAYAIRLKYNRTAGTGTLQVTMMGK